MAQKNSKQKNNKARAFSSATKSEPKSTGSTAESRRELMRLQRQREAREKKVRTGVTIGIVAVVVAGILAGLIWLVPALAARKSAAADPYALSIGSATASVTVDIYQDFMCPYCGQFDRAQASDLAALVDAGTVKVDFHIMAFLDDSSNGTKYSTRAANAFVAVAQREPSKALAFNSALYQNQPAEGSNGLTDAEIADRARQAGVSDSLAATFASLQNVDFVSRSNQAAFDAGVTSTPTVKINGAAFKGNLYAAGALKDAVTKTVGSK